MRYVLEFPLYYQIDADSWATVAWIQNIKHIVTKWAMTHEHENELHKIKFKVFLNSVEVILPQSWYTQWLLTVDPSKTRKHKIVRYPSILDRITNVIHS